MRLARHDLTEKVNVVLNNENSLYASTQNLRAFSSLIDQKILREVDKNVGMSLAKI